MFLFYPQGQLEQEEGAGEGMDKKDDMLRLSLTSLKEEDMEEDPLKTNRALAELLVSDRRPTATPIGVEEVLKIFFFLALVTFFFCSVFIVCLVLKSNKFKLHIVDLWLVI